MTSLKDVNFGINQYCGPAVLSALTGESTDRCAAVISAVSGKKEIKAVNRAHLKEALKRLRFNVEDTIFGGSSLYGTLHRMHTHDGLYIVFVSRHVVAVEVVGTEIYICDNHCKTPLDVKQSARLTQRVGGVLKVSPKDPPKFVGQVVELKKHPNSIDIVSHFKYENPEDDTTYSLGYIRFKDDEERRMIMSALSEVEDE